MCAVLCCCHGMDCRVAVDVQDETGNVHRSPVTSLSFSPEEVLVLLPLYFFLRPLCVGFPPTHPSKFTIMLQRHEVLASKCHGIVSCELLDSTARLWVSTSTRTGACSCILMTDDSFLVWPLPFPSYPLPSWPRLICGALCYMLMFYSLLLHRRRCIFLALSAAFALSFSVRVGMGESLPLPFVLVEYPVSR